MTGQSRIPHVFAANEQVIYFVYYQASLQPYNHVVTSARSSSIIDWAYGEAA